MSPSSFSACSISPSPCWPGCAICRFSSICCICSSNCLAASLSPERDSRSMRSIMLLRSCCRITLVFLSSGRASCCGLSFIFSASCLRKLSSAARRFSVSFLISSSLAPRSSACLSASCAAFSALSTSVISPSSMVTASDHSEATTSRNAASVRARSSWLITLRRPRYCPASGVKASGAIIIASSATPIWPRWLASSARMRRCSISARGSGLVNSRSGRRVANGSLWPSLPASSLAVRVSVTSAPA